MENESKKNKKENVVAGETQEVSVVNEEMLEEHKVEVDKVEEKIIENKEEKEDVRQEEKKDNKLKTVKKQNISVNVKNKKLSKKAIILIVVGCLLFSLILAFGIIVCVNKINTNVYKNVFFYSKDVSGYSVSDLEKFIDEENTKLNKEVLIDLYQGENKLSTINSSDIKLNINKEISIKNIMSFGRNGNIFSDNFKIIKTLFGRAEIPVEYTYDVEKLNEILKNIDVELDGRFVEDTYNVDEAKQILIIKRGSSGISLDYNEVKENILNAILGGENTTIVAKTTEKTPISIKAEEIYNSVKREPVDASVDRNKKPVEIKNEVYGIDFNAGELQALLDLPENKAEQKEIEFKITLVEPKVKLKDIAYDLCLDKICGLTTYFDPGQIGRSNNIKVALSYLNDQLIMPGETFSYNAVIGDTNAAKGYKAAAIFKGGRVVNEMGGGICQTSSTLYNVALMADLQIVERYAHGLPVGYVRPSLDATVYGDVLDFKFKNTRNYPIKIVTSYSSAGEMNISLYGTREETEYEIELVSKYLYTINYPTEYIQDASLPEGSQVVEYNGVNGYASEAYFIKKLNGKVIENRYLSKDVYKPQTKTVRIGTKKADNSNQGQS